MVKPIQSFSDPEIGLRLATDKDPLVPIGNDGMLVVNFPGVSLESKEVFTHAWLTRTDRRCHYRLVTVSKTADKNDDHYDASRWYHIRIADDRDEHGRLFITQEEKLLSYLACR